MNAKRENLRSRTRTGNELLSVSLRISLPSSSLEFPSEVRSDLSLVVSLDVRSRSLFSSVVNWFEVRCFETLRPRQRHSQARPNTPSDSMPSGIRDHEQIVGEHLDRCSTEGEHSRRSQRENHAESQRDSRRNRQDTTAIHAGTASIDNQSFETNRKITSFRSLRLLLVILFSLSPTRQSRI